MKLIFETADFKKANKNDMTVMSDLILALAQREEPELNSDSTEIAGAVPETDSVPVSPEPVAEKAKENPAAADKTEAQAEPAKEEKPVKPVRHRRAKAEKKEAKMEPEVIVASVPPLKEEEIPQAPAPAVTEEKPAEETSAQAEEKKTLLDEEPVAIDYDSVFKLGKTLSLRNDNLRHRINKLLSGKYGVKRFRDLSNDKVPDVYLDLKAIEESEA